MSNNVVGLIPARRGSKRLPRKNVSLLAGRPLIEWTVLAALEATCLTRVVVTTDDPEVREICEQLRCDVIERPPTLAMDESTADDVIAHYLNTDTSADILVYLQPTSPLRTAEDIDRAVERLARSQGECVVSIAPLSANSRWLYFLKPGDELLPVFGGPHESPTNPNGPVYRLNGAIYAAKASPLRLGVPLLELALTGYVMPEERSVDIDTRLDFLHADALLSEHMGRPRRSQRQGD